MRTISRLAKTFSLSIILLTASLCQAEPNQCIADCSDYTCKTGTPTNYKDGCDQTSSGTCKGKFGCACEIISSDGGSKQVKGTRKEFECNIGVTKPNQIFDGINRLLQEQVDPISCLK